MSEGERCFTRRFLKGDEVLKLYKIDDLGCYTIVPTIPNARRTFNEFWQTNGVGQSSGVTHSSVSTLAQEHVADLNYDDLFLYDNAQDDNPRHNNVQGENAHDEIAHVENGQDKNAQDANAQDANAQAANAQHDNAHEKNAQDSIIRDDDNCWSDEEDSTSEYVVDQTVNGSDEEGLSKQN
ncbi:hypothetical protein R6Q57_006324 [Mikania cordata]